jgi:tetratricopeptide (TPR) repeat protein
MFQRITNATPAPAEAIVPTAVSSRRIIWLLAAGLGLVTLVLYWPAVHNGFVNFDDNIYVTTNSHVQNGLTIDSIKWAFTSVVGGNWHPVTMMSHMLDCQLYGLKPWGHHLSSVLLHAANTVLLFLLLCKLTGATWRSAWVAAFFGWHPVHVESVAWVAERKDVLCAFFWMLALWFYVKRNESFLPRDPRATSPSTPHAARYYWLVLLSFALCLMSKPMGVTLPCVLLLLDWWPLGRFKTVGAWLLIREKISFFALSAAVSVVTMVMQEQEGAMTTLQNLSPGLRIENTVVSYCRYLGELFWPVKLAIFYPHRGYWPLNQLLLAIIFLTGLSLFFWAQRKQHPFLIAGWLWFVGTLVPVIGLVQVGFQAMADRYTYIPSVGVLLLLVWGAFALARQRRQWLAGLSVAGLTAAAYCLALTQHQLGYWRDSETLFRHDLEVTDNNPIARNNLGDALLNLNQTNAAISEFQEALRLMPDDASIQYNLGVALTMKGQDDAAARYFQAAIRLKPNYAEPHSFLGLALNKKGQTNAAISEFEAAIRIDPDNSEAHNYLGNLLALKGQTDEAISQFQKTLRLKPNYADAHYNLANALLIQGQTNMAIEQFQETVRFKPDDADARYLLGNLLAKQGRLDEAIQQFQETVRITPKNADAHNNLGNLLVKGGQAGAAIVEFQKAIQLKPNDADAHYNLGNAFLKNGQLDDTIREFQEAVHLNSDYAPAHYYLGVALVKKGRLDEAILQFQEAIRLKPDYAIAHNRLGIALGGTGRLDEAITQFQEAVRFRPDYAEARTNLARAVEMKNAPAAR